MSCQRFNLVRDGFVLGSREGRRKGSICEFHLLPQPLILIAVSRRIPEKIQ
jgi:hypothetical protein